MVYTGLPGLFFSANYALFFGELCTQNPKLCELCNIFWQKLERFLQRSGGYLQRSKLRLFWSPWRVKKNLATIFYKPVANLVTGVVEKADCSSTG